jgi:hypothetical protein
MVPNRRGLQRGNSTIHLRSEDDELAGLSKDQRNKRVGDAIRELFPLIPDRDVDEILMRGFGEVRYAVDYSNTS